ncbi:MAG: Transcriptional regulator WhiB [Acidimicrobiales bacterium]|jgi:WhiB family redox-sensing transcriptional regulator|nr:Transcriptional regulator WhiB [Acidimicrobiales bacterium]
MTNTQPVDSTSPRSESLGAYIMTTPDMPWLDDAACGDLPLEALNIFFVEAGRSIAASTVAMCAKCPVRAACLDHAYRHEIVGGYFGGISPGQRRSLSHSDARALIGAA